MFQRKILSVLAAAVIGAAGTMASSPTPADDVWDMMNPAWWMGFDDDDDDWKYWAYGPGAYAWGGPYGWGGYPGYYGAPPHALAYQPGLSQQEPPPKLPE